MFLSSHLMSEMALTADHLIVIGRGRLIADTSVAEFIAQASLGRGGARAHAAGRRAARRAGRRGRDGRPATERELLEVSGLTGAEIGDAAARARRAARADAAAGSLEEAFMELTRDAVEYHAGSGHTEADETVKEAA